MTFASILFLPLLFFVGSPDSQKPAAKPSFSFNGVGYFHRFSKGNLHEFTPKSQRDLKKFTDMVTVNHYPNIKDGESLAKTANSILETYKANKAMVVRTDSVPRTAAKEAEHLIVVLFPRPTFVEASFCRVALSDGFGKSLVYSHRIYGKKVGNAMSQWLAKSGQKIENALMKMAVPKL
jgi:hypothetical protein